MTQAHSPHFPTPHSVPTARASREISSTQKNLRNRKRRIEYRLGDRDSCDRERPLLGAPNVHYEVAVKIMLRLRAKLKGLTEC